MEREREGGGGRERCAKAKRRLTFVFKLFIRPGTNIIMEPSFLLLLYFTKEERIMSSFARPLTMASCRDHVSGYRRRRQQCICMHVYPSVEQMSNNACIMHNV